MSIHQLAMELGGEELFHGQCRGNPPKEDEGPSGPKIALFRYGDIHQAEIMAQRQLAYLPLEGATCINENDPSSILFDQFCTANTFQSIMQTFQQLCDLVEEQPRDHEIFYQRLKKKLTSWKAQSLWSRLDKRASNREYKRGACCLKTRVLIIGGGPCGLRTAIEVALLGGKAVVVEKRDRFSRNNVLHLWPYLIHDLKGLGAKKFFGKFCAGAIDHISIRALECILLKVALLMGVEIHPLVTFEDLREPHKTSAGESFGWRAQVSPPDHPVSEYEFDVLIGADGKRNTLKGFRRKEFRGKLAIAITANYINRNTQAEARVEEISGVAFIFNQKFFKDLNAQTGIDLENIVYYKDDTHYFVMTAKKHSLLLKGVLIQDFDDPARLLAKQNVDQEALLAYAKEAADVSTRHQLPNLEFAHNHYGQPDVAMFDFTSMFAAEHASRVIERQGYKLLIQLVGDSLLEPFWPTGSGLARGFLSGLDAAWVIRSWASGTVTPLEVMAERESIYQLLSQTTPENISKNLSQYTIDPNNRYPNLNPAFFKPHQVKNQYDGEDLAYLDQIVQTADLQSSRYEMIRDCHNLLKWFQRELDAYRHIIKVMDLSRSWQNGLALCSLIHKYRPELIDVHSLDHNKVSENNQLAFNVAEKEFGIRAITTGVYMAGGDMPDKLSMTSYLSQFYEYFRKESIKPAKITKPQIALKMRGKPRSPSSKLAMLNKLGSRIRQRRHIASDSDSQEEFEKETDLDYFKRPRQPISTQGAAKKRLKEVEEFEGPMMRGYKKMEGLEPEDEESKVLRVRREMKALRAGVRGQNKVSALAKDLADKFKGEPATEQTDLKKAGIPTPRPLLQKNADSDLCYFCQKTVYLVERHSAEGLYFHRGCFRCEYCGTSLRIGGYSFLRAPSGEAKFYCHQHYGMKKPFRRPRKRSFGDNDNSSGVPSLKVNIPSPSSALSPPGSSNIDGFILKTPERIEYVTESEQEESEFEQTQHNLSGLQDNEESESESSSDELAFEDDDLSEGEISLVELAKSYSRKISETYKKKKKRRSAQVDDDDNSGSDTETGTVGASDADYETGSDTERDSDTDGIFLRKLRRPSTRSQKAMSGLDRSKEESSESNREKLLLSPTALKPFGYTSIYKSAQPQEKKELKPSATTAAIMRNRMAFFSVVSEPVRIDAKSFLGLRPPVEEPKEDERIEEKNSIKDSEPPEVSEDPPISKEDEKIVPEKKRKKRRHRRGDKHRLTGEVEESMLPGLQEGTVVTVLNSSEEDIEDLNQADENGSTDVVSGEGSTSKELDSDKTNTDTEDQVESIEDMLAEDGIPRKTSSTEQENRDSVTSGEDLIDNPIDLNEARLSSDQGEEEAIVVDVLMEKPLIVITDQAEVSIPLDSADQADTPSKEEISEPSSGVVEESLVETSAIKTTSGSSEEKVSEQLSEDVFMDNEVLPSALDSGNNVQEIEAHDSSQKTCESVKDSDMIESKKVSESSSSLVETVEKPLETPDMIRDLLKEALDIHENSSEVDVKQSGSLPEEDAHAQVVIQGVTTSQSDVDFMDMSPDNDPPIFTPRRLRANLASEEEMEDSTSDEFESLIKDSLQEVVNDVFASQALDAHGVIPMDSGAASTPDASSSSATEIVSEVIGEKLVNFVSSTVGDLYESHLLNGSAAEKSIVCNESQMNNVSETEDTGMFFEDKSDWTVLIENNTCDTSGYSIDLNELAANNQADLSGHLNTTCLAEDNLNTQEFVICNLADTNDLVEENIQKIANQFYENDDENIDEDSFNDDILGTTLDVVKNNLLPSNSFDPQFLDAAGSDLTMLAEVNMTDPSIAPDLSMMVSENWENKDTASIPVLSKLDEMESTVINTEKSQDVKKVISEFKMDSPEFELMPIDKLETKQMLERPLVIEDVSQDSERIVSVESLVMKDLSPLVQKDLLDMKTYGNDEEPIVGSHAKKEALEVRAVSEDKILSVEMDAQVMEPAVVESPSVKEDTPQEMENIPLVDHLLDQKDLQEMERFANNMVPVAESPFLGKDTPEMEEVPEEKSQSIGNDLQDVEPMLTEENPTVQNESQKLQTMTLSDNSLQNNLQILEAISASENQAVKEDSEPVDLIKLAANNSCLGAAEDSVEKKWPTEISDMDLTTLVNDNIADFSSVGDLTMLVETNRPHVDLDDTVLMESGYKCQTSSTPVTENIPASVVNKKEPAKKPISSVKTDVKCVKLANRGASKLDEVKQAKVCTPKTATKKDTVSSESPEKSKTPYRPPRSKERREHAARTAGKSKSVASRSAVESPPKQPSKAPEKARCTAVSKTMKTNSSRSQEQNTTAKKINRAKEVALISKLEEETFGSADALEGMDVVLDLESSKPGFKNRAQSKLYRSASSPIKPIMALSQPLSSIPKDSYLERSSSLGANDKPILKNCMSREDLQADAIKRIDDLISSLTEEKEHDKQISPTDRMDTEEEDDYGERLDTKQIISFTVDDETGSEKLYTVDEKFVHQGRRRRQNSGKSSGSKSGSESSSFTISTPSSSVASTSSVTELHSTQPSTSNSVGNVLSKSSTEESLSKTKLSSPLEESISFEELVEINKDKDDLLDDIEIDAKDLTLDVDKSKINDKQNNNVDKYFPSSPPADITADSENFSSPLVTTPYVSANSTSATDDSYFTPDPSDTNLSTKNTPYSSPSPVLKLDANSDKALSSDVLSESSDQKSLHSNKSDSRSSTYSPRKLKDAKWKFFSEAAQVVRIDPNTVFSDIPRKKKPSDDVDVQESNRKNIEKTLELNTNWKNLESGTPTSPTAAVPHKDAVSGENDVFYTPTSIKGKHTNGFRQDDLKNPEVRKRLLPATPKERGVTAEEILLDREAELDKTRAAAKERARLKSDQDLGIKETPQKSKQRPESATTACVSRITQKDVPANKRPMSATADFTVKSNSSTLSSTESPLRIISASDGASTSDQSGASPNLDRKLKKGKKSKENVETDPKKEKKRSILSLLLPSRSVERKEKDKEKQKSPPPEKSSFFRMKSPPMGKGRQEQIPSQDKKKSLERDNPSISGVKIRSKKNPVDHIKEEAASPQRRSMYDEFAPLVEDLAEDSRKNKEDLQERLQQVAPPPAKAPHTSLRPPTASMDEFETESDAGDDKISVRSFQAITQGMTEEELSKMLKKQQKAVVKRQKESELKRLRVAQEIQRHLEEVEFKQRQIEEKGILIEQALRGEGKDAGKDESQLMQDWFNVVHEKNMLVRYESELMVHARELELEDRQSRLENQLRELMQLEDSERTKEKKDEEQKVLQEILEVVEQRDALVALLEEDRLKPKEAPKTKDYNLQ